MGSKIITNLTDYMSRKNYARRELIGNCVYVPLKNGINVKFRCEQRFVAVEVISKACGKIDYVELPFRDYFEARKCAVSEKPIYPFIDEEEWGNKKEIWGFSQSYKEMIPTEQEIANLARVMDRIVALYDVPEEEDA